MLKSTLTAVLIGAAPLAAWAACPDASTMAGDGVWVQTNDGGVWHMRQGPENVIVETSYYPDEPAYVTESRFGLYFLKDGQLTGDGIAPDSITRYEYPDLSAVPHPDSNGTWTETIKIFHPGETQPEINVFSVSRGSLIDTSIGDCRYQARVVVATLRPEEGGPWTTQYSYIPELGIGIFVAGGENPLSYEYLYDPIAISASRP